MLKLAQVLHASAANTHHYNLVDGTSTGTFVPNRGFAKVRSDYILTFVVTPLSCWVDEKFQLHAASDDHLPLRLSVVFPATARVPLQPRKVVPYSRSDIHKDCSGGAFNGNECRKRVANRLAAISPAPMPVDATSHAYIYNQSVIEILVDEYHAILNKLDCIG